MASLATLLLASLSLAGIAYAADAKIVFNATNDHNKWAYTEAAMAGYRSAAAGASIVIARSPADLEREAADADAVIGGLSKDVFAKAKKLRWVQTYSAGVEMTAGTNF